MEEGNVVINREKKIKKLNFERMDFFMNVFLLVVNRIRIGGS